MYKCGFAGSQEAYEDAMLDLFSTLTKVDKMLAKSTYLLTDDAPTYVDLRLFMCLIRFDAVYVVHFKTNVKMIKDFEHIKRWVRHLYQDKGLSATTDIDHIKRHYFMSHSGPNGLNPKAFVPMGPVPWWENKD